ncbi:FtsB family cell division protein [Bacillus massilinigeriensis]|uniref:FtsB family cell division protein n=1 Tax=Bacillus massilionigeriensis TaxID=1805475 RepID=UPI00096AE9B9|nr:septum formation initiator family protein [Bacillus massilionigeriensis]
MGAVRKRKVSKIQTNYVRQQEIEEIHTIKKKKRLVRRLSFFFVLAAIASYFMISSLISQTYTIDRMHKEKNQLDQELENLKKKEDVLKEEIVKLNDDEYIAKLARKDYFLSKRGEIIFSLPEDNLKENTTE